MGEKQIKRIEDMAVANFAEMLCDYAIATHY